MPTLSERLGAQIKEKRQALATKYDNAKQADGTYDFDAAALDDVRAKNSELEKLSKEYESAVEIDQIAAKNLEALGEISKPANTLPFAGKGGNSRNEAPMSFGEAAVKSLYKRDPRGGLMLAGDRPQVQRDQDIELAGFDFVKFKTTMTTAAGFAPENLRSGRLQLSAQRPLRVADVLPTIGISTGSAYTYMLESTFTNNAGEISENDGTGAAEGALVYTETEKAVRRVATMLPVTDEQLADVSGMTDLINGRLTYMVENRLDSQILQGDGNAPNIDGFYSQVTQSQAKGADPIFDAIFKGMIKVMWTGFANPTACILHPNDWQEIRLTRTTDGVYILGNPADAGPERLFGVPVVVTSAATENTALTGDFLAHSALVYRQGVEIQVSNSHSDYFKKFLQAIRASLRAAVVVFRATAFTEVTGI